jgi:hypothetical protein
MRRGAAYAILFGLGALLIYLPLVRPPALVWVVVMVGLGVLSIVMAERLRRATLHEIELTDTEIRDTNGQVLALIDDIKLVDRGAFAFKPSNGFTLVLAGGQPRAWAPGLWWRFGRRVGVGGVTSAGQTKFMAEQIAFRIGERA